MSIPVHAAFIMDGNGRWAKSKGLPRMYGHKRGLDTAEKVIDYARIKGIKYLSLYVFSTENWKRPKNEVASLFDLAKKYLKSFEKFCKDKIRVVISGERDGLPQDLISRMDEIQDKTKYFDSICVNLCINYGGQKEIIEAAKKIIDENVELSEIAVSQHLYNSFIPAPDIIIRTGGQKRLSNFLLYQSAYAELYFSNTFWPDFTESEFESILQEYALRKRSFGGIVDGQ